MKGLLAALGLLTVVHVPGAAAGSDAIARGAPWFPPMLPGHGRASLWPERRREELGMARSEGNRPSSPLAHSRSVKTPISSGRA